jgi:hypothetical protein
MKLQKRRLINGVYYLNKNIFFVLFSPFSFVEVIKQSFSSGRVDYVEGILELLSVWVNI